MNYELISRSLICPVCGAMMSPKDDGHTIVCRGTRAHSFDVAASGYVNLAGPKQSGGGDSKELVRARSAFLSAGYYKPFADEIISAAGKYNAGGFIVDAGCGEGYYTIKVAESFNCDVCGIDLSKFAVEAAAKAAAKTGGRAGKTLFCVAGIFAMPLMSESTDLIINIFAPCAEEEFTRILKPGGYLITAGAGPEHLYGLKSALYDNPTKNENRADLPKSLKLVGCHSVKFTIELNRHEDIEALFSMTPYFYRTAKTGIDRLSALETLTTPVDIELLVYKKEAKI
jgi:23S rRNA (guanine745-N1)-methyltransferase